jgi:hypothetical protein
METPATNRNKPAVFSIGVRLRVPETLAAGEVVHITIEMVRFRVTVRNNQTILRRILFRPAAETKDRPEISLCPTLFLPCPGIQQSVLQI